jgi:tRNA(fMet)-specific endonuclease VapC
MIYALDTNIISFLLRPSKNPDVVARFERIIEQGHDYVIPPLSYYEIAWHLLRKKASAQLLILDRLYKNSASAINMSEEEFITAAKLKAYLMAQGTPIGERDGDIFIAAHCIVGGYTLVTDNRKDFDRIDGLSHINWKD